MKPSNVWTRVAPRSCGRKLGDIAKNYYTYNDTNVAVAELHHGVFACKYTTSLQYQMAAYRILRTLNSSVTIAM